MEVSGCTIHIQEVGHETVENKGWCSRSVVPDTANRIGPVIRKVVRSSSVKIITARATLKKISKFKSQGWFWYHATCAENSIKGKERPT